jgi:hypothetical protein
MRDLHPARELLFAGESLSAGSLAVAWVYTETASVYDRPNGQRLRGEVRTQFERLSVLETAERGGRRWFRVGERAWVSATGCSCAEAELAGTTAPERRCCAVNMMTEVSFPATILVRSIDVSHAGECRLKLAARWAIDPMMRWAIQ